MSSLRKLLSHAIALFGLSASIVCNAEPTSPPLSITYIRPYSGGSAVFIATNNPPGSFCSTSVYTIDMTTPSGKAMYAAALAALLAGKTVQLELAACDGGAGGVGTHSLQSIYIRP
jgi:hypothetical protein